MPKRTVALLLLLSVAAVAAADDRGFTPDELLDVIQRGVANAQRLISDPTSTASYLGTMFSAQWFVVSHLTGHNARTKINGTLLREIVLSQRLSDGSWMPVLDANLATGTPEATLWCYWFMKVLGEDINAPHMVTARQWLLRRGGLRSVNQMHKLFLAVTGNYPFSAFKSVPFWIFDKSGMAGRFVYVKEHVSQWVFAHLPPMAYIIRYAPIIKLGPLFNVSELIPAGEARPAAADAECQSQPQGAKEVLDEATAILMKEMFALQQPRGSFGTYTLSTMLSMIAMQDFAARFGGSPEIPGRIERGFQFVDELYSLPGYHGVPDWGLWWDHALLGIGMRDGGASIEANAPFADEVLATQQPNGGIPFGWDFEYAPDTDDTAETIIWWSKMGAKYRPAIDKAVSWLFTMQNTNGGWSAFDRGHTGAGFIGWVINWMAAQFAGSAQIFDPSEADVTAHILEALGTMGITESNSENVRNAVQFCRDQQDEDGKWKGRWAINYVYCTGTVLVGLARAGHDLNEPWLVKATNWLIAHQNADGGWGETSASYNDPSFAGKGISTPTQTAWAVMGLIEAQRAGQPVMRQIDNGMKYLIRSFQQSGNWTDPSCVGTGHPGLLYMIYPAYAPAFSLTAAARYYSQYFGAIPQGK